LPIDCPGPYRWWSSESGCDCSKMRKCLTVGCDAALKKRWQRQPD